MRAAGHAQLWLQPLASPRLCHAAVPRRLRVLTRSHDDFKGTLRSLQSLGDVELGPWAASNGDRLSLSFLAWLAEEEDAASGAAREALWQLGGKLMMLREGLEPASSDQLREELRSAALSAQSGSGEGPAAASTSGQGQRSEEGEGAALARPGFNSIVQQTAALGLSPEGLALFQQQAVALEAVVGTSRARSLVEVIGRMRVEVGGGEGGGGGGGADPLQAIMGSDAASRILEVLLTLGDRAERAAVLPEAFSPPAAAGGGYESDGGYQSPEEDLLYTTPLQLLQAIDLYLGRLERQGLPGADADAWLLPGDALGLDPEEVEGVLLELREDVMGYWEGADTF